MKSPFLLIAPLWVLSLGAAFFVGKSNPPAQDVEAHATAATKSASAAGAGAASANGQSSQAAATRSASERLAASGVVTSGADSIAAVKDIARHDDPIARTNALLALIETLDLDDFEGVVAGFRELGITDERRGEYAILLSAWAKLDPNAALAYTTENTGGNFANNTILATWAANDPSAAIAWAESNHENQDNANPWLVGVIRGLAPNDVPRATNLMETLPRSRVRGQALQSMVSMMVSRDSDGAKAWAETIDDEYLRAGARASTAEALAERDAGDAAQWLAQLGDIDALNRVGEDISGSYYDSNPEDAVTWVSTLPPAAISEAAEGIVNRVVRQDPVQAAEYISQLAQQNPETNFDSSIRELVGGSMRRDPELAAVWVGGIQNERQRNRYYHRVLGDWQNRNTAEATAWMQENQETLPRSISQRFLRQQQGQQ